MYSPKIKETLIPRIYRLAKKQGVRMTAWVNRILEEAVEKEERQDEIRHENVHR